MTDRADRIESLKDHVAPRWSPERSRRVWQRVERRTQARGRVAVVAALALVCIALGVFLLRPGARLADHGSEPVAAAPTLRLADGTEVASLSRDARVEAVDAEAGVTALRLVTGSARFDVAHREGRRFRVLAGNAVVEVLGTRFVVTLEGSGTRVSVERGRVRVSWPDGERVLARGESVSTASEGRVAAPGEDALVEEAPVDGPPAEEPGPAVVKQPPAPSAPVGPSWEELARSGEYAAALTHLEAGSQVADDPEELLLAADVARLGGSPQRATAWLRRVVDRHPGDSRAPLAAFTLGRTLLDQLGQPREAAEAFARVRGLAPGGALAEDALAREVESWARAGEPQRASKRAAEYLRRYPDGRRRRAVMRYAVGP